MHFIWFDVKEESEGRSREDLLTWCRQISFKMNGYLHSWFQLVFLARKSAILVIFRGYFSYFLKMGSMNIGLIPLFGILEVGYLGIETICLSKMRQRWTIFKHCVLLSLQIKSTHNCSSKRKVGDDHVTRRPFLKVIVVAMVMLC